MLKVDQFNIIKNNEHKYSSSLDLNFKEGSWVGLLGLNGTGKSTFLKHISGEDSVHDASFKTTGEVWIENQSIAELKKNYKGKAHKIIYLNSEFSVPPKLQVIDLLKMGEPLVKTEGISIADSLNKIIHDMELNCFLARRLSTLSEGELQWAMLARVLFQNPKILIVDEALSKVDFYRLNKLRLLFKAFTQQGHLLFLVSHDYRLLLDWCDSLLVFSRNLILVESNSFNEHPAVQEVFGGSIPDWVKRKY